MLALISSTVEMSLPYLVLCLHSEKKVTNQLYTESGISSSPIFWSNVLQRTVSKALEKSKAKTITYELVDSMSVIECSIATRAAVVDPVCRNAY